MLNVAYLIRLLLFLKKENENKSLKHHEPKHIIKWKLYLYVYYKFSSFMTYNFQYRLIRKIYSYISFLAETVSSVQP